MGTAAEFYAVVPHADHPNDVAVFLTEQGHRAHILRFLNRHLLHLNRQEFVDVSVYDIFYLSNFFTGHCLEVVEVESQVVLIHIGSGLHDVVAQYIPECLLQQVGGTVSSGDAIPLYGVNLQGYPVAFGYCIHFFAVIGVHNVEENAVFFYHIHDVIFRISCSHDTRIVELAAAGCVERCTVENQEFVIPVIGTAELNCCLCLGLGVSQEFRCRKMGIRPRILPRFIGGVSLAGSGGFLLVRHALTEAFHIRRLSVLCQDFLGELNRESVGVVQLECQHSGQHLLALGIHITHIVVQNGETVRQGFGELGLFVPDDFLDVFLLLHQFRIRAAGYLDDLVGQFCQEVILIDSEDHAVSCRTANQSPKHVAAAFVARQDTVRNHEYHGSQVIGNDSQADVVLLVALLVLHAGLFCYRVQNVADGVDIEDGVHTLHDAGHTLQSHSGIDVLMCQV